MISGVIKRNLSLPHTLVLVSNFSKESRINLYKKQTGSKEIAALHKLPETYILKRNGRRAVARAGFTTYGARREVKDEQVKLKSPPSNHSHTTGAIVIATEEKHPHNHAEILKTADAAVDGSSREKLYDQLQYGVFLNQHKKKYWVDKNSKNCFMLYAKDLSITWAETSSYWHWTLIKESSDESIVAAELLNVCWLEVHGRFNTANLTPRTRYEVIFVVMLKDPAYGWEVPINFRLILPNGSRQEHKENMMERERGKWIEIPAGEFETLQENAGEMEISLYEYEGGNWKRGLLIKGVVIRPTSQSSA